MANERWEIRDGITLFAGKMSRNLLVEPIVANAYVLEDRGELIVFDPSCGRAIGRSLETHLARRRQETGGWADSSIIAGHSHIDHANNFYLNDLIGAATSHVYVHELGFSGDGEVLNDPKGFVSRVLADMQGYYNPYLSFFFPYNLLIYPLAALNAVAPATASAVFSLVGSLPFAPARDGGARPEPLREEGLQQIDLGGLNVKGWRIGDKVVMPTPGHSPCSISLVWPERKAICISDADWIGNPVFMDSSLKDCVASLENIRALAEGGAVDLLLPAHGIPQEGVPQVLAHLDSRIQHLADLRQEVLAFRDRYCEDDIRRLTRRLVNESPVFGILKKLNYPRFVVFAHNVVAICLEEADS